MYLKIDFDPNEDLWKEKIHFLCLLMSIPCGIASLFFVIPVLLNWLHPFLLGIALVCWYFLFMGTTLINPSWTSYVTAAWTEQNKNERPSIRSGLSDWLMILMVCVFFTMFAMVFLKRTKIMGDVMVVLLLGLLGALFVLLLSWNIEDVFTYYFKGREALFPPSLLRGSV